MLAALFQNPTVLARRLATLDLLSGGRVLAGLGQGWVPQAFTAAGIPMTRRGAGFEEHIAAVRAVWNSDPVSFHGHHYQIPESQIGLKPLRPEGIPILLAAGTPAAAAQAGRLGTGLNPVLNNWDWLAELVTAFRRAAEAADHDPTNLPVVVRVNGTITNQPQQSPAPLTGSVD